MTTSDFPAPARLAARDLACLRGGRLVFEGLTFSVARGEALVLTGANGAGKSSLLRQIAGLLEIDHSAIALEGGDSELTIGEQAHYVGHLDALKPSMSVLETLHFWKQYFGGADDAAVSAALEAFALTPLADLPVGYLSAGQRRRVSLARMLVAPRPLWLLDEPTVALDTANISRLLHLMKQHLASGGIIVAATHLDLGLPSAARLHLGAEVAA
ncbi:heme exporter protein CcmA [Parvibaculum lavamentivorans DS-1]|uniref:Heme exporter protein CcmA n=1 Tax=Parvibaculum lavamentivorans (strain DS-1 / DSM 13023 / NCIMB 13966) TaxID=402881 RepID=A7HSZ1_PARL1|nr:heme ABC exporter ATP-binding protein CcmA [Parvibaculum lavamentivorans]ABS63024.1 heme exporter protein CcmA [Parvibaculum lavamentivorans DS-1]